MAIALTGALLALLAVLSQPGTASAQSTGLHYFAIEELEPGQHSGTIVRRGTAGSDGVAYNNLILAPNTRYRQWLLQAATLKVGFYEFTTGNAGQAVNLPPIFLFDSTSLDADGDGLHTEGELILGTLPGNPDTDGDGIPDGPEVQNGTNPLDGTPAVTGAVASVDTPGSAVDVCAREGVAAVADGSAGVSIFDVAEVTNPLIIGQVNTPGSAGAVACADDRIAVADGIAGLAVIDLSDPPAASIEYQLDLDGTVQSVAVSGDVVYTGLTSGLLMSFDLPTGTLLGQVNLGNSVQDIGNGPNHLYALTSSTLYALDPDSLNITGSEISPGTASARKRLFVGTDIAYTTRNNGNNTFSLADPADPVLISSDASTQLGWRHIVTNGSGIGVAVVGTTLANGNISLYDVTDPTNNTDFITELATPGAAKAVSLFNGIAYVADGSAGLQVVNYLAFDAFGVPPTVTLETNAVGGEIEEGKRLALNVEVTDDVQVRNVEFLVDGLVVADDGTFPFNHRLNAPAFSQQTSVTLQARAFDTGGNMTASTEIVLDVIEDVIPPSIDLVNPEDGSERSQGLTAVTVILSESVQSSLIDINDFELTGPGGVVNPLSLQFRNTDRTLLVTYDPLPIGDYQLNIDTSAIVDLAGNAFVGPAIVSNFTLVESTIFWVGGDGDWNDPSRWSTGVVPGPADSVFIGGPGDLVVTHSSGTTTVMSLNSADTLQITGGTLNIIDDSQTERLILAGGSLSGSGDLTVNELMTWTGGILTGTGGVPALNIAASAMLNITGSVFHHTREIVNSGTTNWTAGEIRSGVGARFNNLNQFNAGSDNEYDYDQGGIIPIFTNAGTLTKDSAGLTKFDVTLNNNGTVEVVAGTLQINGGGTSTSNFDVAATTTLSFTANYTADAGTSFTGAGGPTITGGVFSLAAAASDADAVTALNITLETGGNISGAGDLSIDPGGVFNWTGGTLTGIGSPNPELNIPVTAELNISATVIFHRRTINNMGTTNWTGGEIRSGLGAIFNNQSQLNAATNTEFDYDQGGVAPILNNTGTFTKSLAGITKIDVTFNQSGTVEVTDGTLQVDAGGTSSGNFNVAAIATLSFATSYTAAAGTSFTGDGSTRIDGGIFSIAASASDADAVTALNITLPGTGTISGAGDLTIDPSGVFNWEGGTLTGSGSPNPELNIPATAELKITTTVFLHTRTINNSGTTNWTAGEIKSGLNAVINNFGQFNALVANEIDYDQGGVKTIFNNSGTFTKSVAGTTGIDVTLNQTGDVVITDGKLVISGGGTSSSNFDVAAAKTLNFTAAYTAAKGTSFTGAGDTLVNGGIFTLAGNAVDADAVTALNITLATGGTISGPGDLSIDPTGVFDWSGGTLTGTATPNAELNIPATAELNISTTVFFHTRTINNSGTTKWTAGEIKAGLTAVFNNFSQFNVQTADEFDYDQGGTAAILNNSGTLTKSSVGITKFDVIFNQTGNVVITDGTLQINGGGTSSSNFDVAATKLLNFTAAYTAAKGTSFTGAGDTLIDGGIFTLAANAVDADAVTALNITLATGGTISGSGDLTIDPAGVFTWTGGILTGSGSPNPELNIPATAELKITATVFFQTRTINNSGTTNWTGGEISSGLGAVFNNLAQFNILNAAEFDYDQGGTAAVLNNSGTLTKSSAGLTLFDVIFNNTGSVVITDGTLQVNGGGTSSGGFDVAATKLLNFTAAYTAAKGTSFAGAGDTLIDGGIFTLAANAFDADAVTALNITLAPGGTISGPGDLTIDPAGVFTWTGGILTGSGSPNPELNIPATAELNISATVFFHTRTINNSGTTNWTGGEIKAGLGAIFNNFAQFNVQTANEFDYDQGGTVPILNNSGTLTKSSAGLTKIDVIFNQTGNVVITDGTLQVSGGGTSSSNFDIAATKTLNFTAAYTAAKGTSFTGAGDTLINGGIFTLAANAVDADAVTALNITLASGGTISGPGDLTIDPTGVFTWSGGLLTGSGTPNPELNILSTATLNITGTVLLHTRTIDNAGTTNWTAGEIKSGLGAIFNNTSQFNVQSDSEFDYDQGGTIPVLNNSGVLTKNSAGTTKIDVTFNNTGSVQVVDGTLQIAAGGTSSAGFDVAATKSLLFTAAYTAGKGTLITGAGFTEITAGVFNIAADATLADSVIATNLALSGGSIAGAGDLLIAAAGTFNWSGGGMSGTGSTGIFPGAQMNITGSVFLITRTISNAGTTTWSAGEISSGLSAVFENSGLFEVAGDLLFDFDQGGLNAEIVNTGTFRKTAGAGVATVDVDFDNTGGTIDEASGTFVFNGACVNC